MNNLNDDIYFINEKAEKLIVFLFIAVMFVFMVLNPAHKTFTYDELDWTLKFVDSGSYSGMIRGLLNYGYNLPLYYTILYLIFQTGTYSEIFYMLPSIIFVIAGVIGMYFFGRKKDRGTLMLLYHGHFRDTRVTGRLEGSSLWYAFLLFRSYALLLYGKTEGRERQKSDALLYCASDTHVYALVWRTDRGILRHGGSFLHRAEKAFHKVACSVRY